MKQYRLVNSAWQYNNHGMIRGKHQPPPSPHQIYKQGRDQLLNRINIILHDNEDLREKMEDRLNQQALLAEQRIWDNSRTQESLLDYVASFVPKLTVTRSLSVNITKDLKTIQKNAYQKAYKKGESEYTAKKEFEKLKEKIDIFLQSGDQQSDFYGLIIKHLEAIEKQVKEISKDSQPQSKQDVLNFIFKSTDFWSNLGKGSTLSIKQYPINRKIVLYHLEVLKALFSQNVSQGKGIVAEQYVKAVLSGVEYQVDKEMSKITKSIVTGTNASAKLMDKELAQTYAYLAKTEVAMAGGYTVKRFGGTTPDKVDVEISLERDVVKTGGISVKNYTNTSSIHLLTGNLLSILGQTKYATYTYYFLNSYTYNKKIIHNNNNNNERKSDKDLMTAPASLYTLMKKISAVHAIIGGLMAQLNNNNIIMTPTASYLAINNSSGEKMNWKVYSAKTLCDIIVKATPVNLDNYITFSKYFGYPRVVDGQKVISDEKHRFTAMTVELKIAALQKSLDLTKKI